eukprot:gene5912-8155_t
MSTVSVHIQKYSKNARTRHIEYYIVVSFHGRQWSIKKRFSHFLHLHRYLCKQSQLDENITNFKFPVKVSWWLSNDNLLQNRLKELQKYLDLLISTLPSDNSIIKEFLEVESNNLKIIKSEMMKSSNAFKVQEEMENICKVFEASVIPIYFPPTNYNGIYNTRSDSRGNSRSRSYSNAMFRVSSAGMRYGSIASPARSGKIHEFQKLTLAQKAKSLSFSTSNNNGNNTNGKLDYIRTPSLGFNGTAINTSAHNSFSSPPTNIVPDNTHYNSLSSTPTTSYLDSNILGNMLIKEKFLSYTANLSLDNLQLNEQISSKNAAKYQNNTNILSILSEVVTNNHSYLLRNLEFMNEHLDFIAQIAPQHCLDIVGPNYVLVDLVTDDNNNNSNHLQKIKNNSKQSNGFDDNNFYSNKFSPAEKVLTPASSVYVLNDSITLPSSYVSSSAVNGYQRSIINNHITNNDHPDNLDDN